MSQMLKSSGAMGLATMLSRVLGLVREQVYAHFMGDGPVASAFKLAFQIPNLFRRLLGEGALTAAFVPIFKEKERTAGEKEMWHAANAVMSGLVVAACAVVLAGIALVTLVLAVASWQRTPEGAELLWFLPVLHEDTRLMLGLLRVMFPYLLLVCLAAMCVGMLNARGYFFIPALGATSLNVVMIASVLLLAPRFGKTLETQIFALAVGVLVAGLAQFMFQLPSLHNTGFRYRWVTPWRNETVREVVRRMLPGAVGVAAFQLNVLLIQALAFWVDRSIVASFDYAVRLMEFPQGVVGISLATYLLTTLSGLAAEKKYPEFRSTLREGVGHLLFINLLAAVLMLALAEPIVRLLFERGLFHEGSTHRAAIALACLAPGLAAFSLVNLLARAFFALGDTETPMKISVACLLVNLLIALALIGPLRQGGLGVANSISSVVNACLLARALRRKLGRLDWEGLRPALGKMLGAVAAAGALAWGLRLAWTHALGHATLPCKLGEVFVPMLAAGLLYWGLTLALHVPQARELSRILTRRPASAQ